MTQKELDFIKADIEAVEVLLNTPNLRDEAIVNIMAYHTGQAIEKTLKSIIGDNDTTFLNDKNSHTHNIGALVSEASIYDKNLVGKHPYICKNARALSYFNNLRYGDMQIEFQDFYKLFEEAKSLVQEKESEFLKSHPNIEQNKKDAFQEYQKLKPITLQDVPKKMSKKAKDRKKNKSKHHHKSYGGRN